MPVTISTSEFERSRTWLHEIAVALLPAGTASIEESNGDRKYDSSGGLVVNIQQNCWYSFGAGTGGYSPLRLIVLLKPEYSSDDARAWLLAYLAGHAGTGSGASDGADAEGDGGGVNDARALASAEAARELLGRMVPIAGTAAETYWQSRGLASAPPEGLTGYVDAARLGEGALVALLTAHERVVGVQCLYLTPDGHKSSVVPLRRRFNLERAKDAVFRLPAPPETVTGPIDKAGDYIIAEGLEDAASVWELRRAWTILGMPGAGTLQHLELAKGSRVVVVKDGDAADHPATQATTVGVDTLILAGVKVRVTQTSADADANSVLVEGGAEALSTLITHAPEALLSFDGRIRKLATLEGLAFDRERTAIKTVFGASVGTIDAAVKKLRPKPAKPAAEDEPPIPVDPEWGGDVALADALDAAVATSKRFLQAADYVHHIIALWSMMTHIVQSEDVALTVAPQLSFLSNAPNSGKSVALEITSTLAARGHLRSSYSAATLFRKINQDMVTPCLSELHNVLRGGENTTHMLEILNACHRRSEAFVDRCETDPHTGARPVKSYVCWAAIAWTAIGSLHHELQSRAITLLMMAALPDEFAKIDSLHAPKHCTELIDVRRQFAKFALTIRAPLTATTMPAHLFNRDAVNWRPIFALAEMAKGAWPQRALDALDAIGKVERKPPLQIHLLTCIRDAYAGAEQMATADLIEALCADEEDGWQEANHGKRINEYWLRENLRGLIDPVKSQRWHVIAGDENSPKVRGYRLHQFKDAWLRLSIPGAPYSSGPSGTSSPEPDNPLETADVSRPDAKIDPAQRPDQPQPSKSAKKAADAPDVPDGPLESGLPIEKEGTSAEPAAGTSPANGEDTPAPARKRRVGRIEATVLATQRANPDWSVAQIAKRTGRSLSEVRRYLENGKAS